MIEEIMLWISMTITGIFLMLVGFIAFQDTSSDWFFRYVYGVGMFIIGLVLVVGISYILVRDMLDNRKQKESENE